MRAEEAAKVMASQEGAAFINSINQGDAQAVLSHGALINAAISDRASDLEALREMAKWNVDVLAVVDGAGSVKGFAERDQVLSRVILALTE
jgi:predicted transcriptional regulator